MIYQVLKKEVLPRAAETSNMPPLDRGLQQDGLIKEIQVSRFSTVYDVRETEESLPVAMRELMEPKEIQDFIQLADKILEEIEKLGNKGYLRSVSKLKGQYNEIMEEILRVEHNKRVKN